MVDTLFHYFIPIVILSGAIIVGSLFSFLYKKEGFQAGNRTVRVVLATVGTIFLTLFLLIIGFLIKVNFKDYQNAILFMIVMLFIIILLFSLAIFKKDFSAEFKEQSLNETKENYVEAKKNDFLSWILWILLFISVILAYKTYNIFFIISFVVLLIAMLILRIKRDY